MKILEEHNPNHVDYAFVFFFLALVAIGGGTLNTVLKMKESSAMNISIESTERVQGLDL